MKQKGKFSLKITNNKEESKVIIVGTISKEEINLVKDDVIKRFTKDKKIDGFRNNKIPKDILENSVDDLDVWKESAHEIIMQNFPLMLAEEKLIPIGQPQLKFTTLVIGNDVEFELVFFVMPDVELAEYDVLREVEIPFPAEDATKEEINSVILDLKRSLFKKTHTEKNIPKDDKDLPELTDEYISEVSSEYNDINSFKEGIKDSITREKKIKIQSELRRNILEKIVEKSSIKIPKILIDEETKNSYEEFKHTAKHLGTTVKAYLEKQNITEDKLLIQLRKEAEKRSKIQLILNTISAKEDIHPNDKDLEKEVERFKMKNKEIDENEIKLYVNSILTNEIVMKFLENKVKK